MPPGHPPDSAVRTWSVTKQEGTDPRIDIRHLTDVALSPSCQVGHVLIRIQLEESDPPLGSACAEEGSPVGFQGWLELLRVLADLLGSTATSELRSGQVRHRL
jgi:hypothetical protein